MKIITTSLACLALTLSFSAGANTNPGNTTTATILSNGATTALVTGAQQAASNNVIQLAARTISRAGGYPRRFRGKRRTIRGNIGAYRRYFGRNNRTSNRRYFYSRGRLQSRINKRRRRF